jgi:hypothetical protein
MNLKRILFTSVLSFSLLLSPLSASAFDNDGNNDGYVDTVYKDDLDNGKEFFEVKWGPNKGDRVGIVNAYAITPYWNQQASGATEHVRIFTDTVGVENEFNAYPYSVYPEVIYAKLKISDTGAYIYNYSPTTSGSISPEIALFMGWMKKLTYVSAIIDFVSAFSSRSGNHGYVSKQEAYTSSYYSSRDNWIGWTSKKTDLPRDIYAYKAYQTTDRGFSAKFNYNEETWSSGSAHVVYPIASIKYVMKLSDGTPYGWSTGPFTKAHNSYGY